jgi:transcriptional regulator with XRE-family HTH domain
MYGTFLRSLRRSQNLTQQQLAAIVGIAPANLSADENDRQMPSFDMVNTLINGCGYRITIDGAPSTVEVPLAKGGWTRCEEWPDRDPDDPRPPHSGLTVETPMEERIAVIARVLTGVTFTKGST